MIANTRTMSSGLWITIVLFSLGLALRADAAFLINRPNYLGLDSGLVGFWSFDGNTYFEKAHNNVLDLSGQGNHGIFINGTSTQKAGKIGQALEFDGSNDYVDVATFDPHTYNQFAISAWYKSTDNTVGGPGVVDDEYMFAHLFTTPTLNEVIFSITDDVGQVDKFRFVLTNAGSSALYYGTSDITDIRWHHLIAVRTASRILLYVDGVLESDTADSNAGGAMVMDAVDGPWIGDNPGNTEQLHGTLDELRIYDRALSADEIKRLYNMGGTLKVNVTRKDALKEGLVGHWSFDGGTYFQGAHNNVLDLSGQGNNGIFINGTSTQKAGKIGQALEFDSVDDWVNAGSASSLDNLTQKTACAWIYPTGLGGGTEGNVITKIIDATNPGWLMGIKTTATPLHFFFFQGWTSVAGQWRTDANTLPLNTWHHICATYDGSSTLNDPLLYINGLSRTVTEIATPSGTFDDGPNNDLIIGAMVGTTNQRFKGPIDEVRIYNRALTADEIKRLYNMGGTLKVNVTREDTLKEGLVGHWSFDGPDMSQGTNNTWAIDRSGQGNNGRLANTATSSVRAAGKIGQALNFDGVDDIVSVPDPGASSVFDRSSGETVALSFWIKPSALPNNGGNGADMVGKEADSFSNYGIQTLDNKIKFFYRSIVNGWNEWQTTNDVVTIGAWYHIAVSYTIGTGSSIKVYVNGLEVAGSWVLRSGNDTDPQIANNPFLIGSKGASPSKGIIDEVRIYNRALSADEVKRLYNMGR